MTQPAALFILRTDDTYTVSLEIAAEGPSVLAGAVSVTAADRRDVLHALEQAMGLVPSSQGSTPESLAAVGRLLFRLFLPLPIQERLRTWDGPLTVSTNDPTIPWELLHDGRDFLGLRCALARRLITAKAPAPRTAPLRERPTFLFITDPTEDLASATHEAIYLIERLTARGFACDLLRGERASYLNVQEALQSGRYDVIHFAGHAEFDPQRRESTLQLAGGRRLPASQIERVLSGAPLVFLNACASGRETPVEEGERVATLGAQAEGLASAFILGGARGFIGTLWPVSDDGSRDFAAFFYDRLLSGDAIGDALRQTRVYLRAQRPSDPTWSAFTFYGHPSDSLLQPVAGSQRSAVAPTSPQPHPPVSASRWRGANAVSTHQAEAAANGTARREGLDLSPLLRVGAGLLTIVALIALLIGVGRRVYDLILKQPLATPTQVVIVDRFPHTPTPSVPPVSPSPLTPATFRGTPSPLSRMRERGEGGGGSGVRAILPTPTPVMEETPASPTPTPTATATPALQGRIAFVSKDEFGRAVLYVMNADGSGLRRLGPGTDPAWSPDGKRIAFAGLLEVKAGIYIANADGSEQVRLTQGSDWQPTWSPDGRRIAFMSFRKGNREIFVMNADGSGMQNLTRNPWEDRHPSWSPQGDRIAFISNRSGHWQVWIMAPDGSGQVQLTHDSYDHFRPVWSPDGRHIAYGVWTGVRNEIWVMDADGGNPRRIIDEAVYKLEYQGYGLAWEPLSLVSFVSDRDGLPQIHLIAVDGSWQRAITAMPRGAWSPDWAVGEPP